MRCQLKKKKEKKRNEKTKTEESSESSEPSGRNLGVYNNTLNRSQKISSINLRWTETLSRPEGAARGDICQTISSRSDRRRH